MLKSVINMTSKLKGLLLLSGGIDSPVAGKILQDKGIDVHAIHFSNVDVAGPESIDKAKKISALLRFNKLFIVDISNELVEIAKTCKHSYYFVLMKRLMYRLSEIIAKKENIPFLITGESIGQVSSQTLDNLAAINEAVTLPVLRPLIGFDKNEITTLAVKFNTFEISTGPETCDLLGPSHPIVRANLNHVKNEEKKLDLQAMISNALKTLQVFSLESLRVEIA